MVLTQLDFSPTWSVGHGFTGIVYAWIAGTGRTLRQVWRVAEGGCYRKVREAGQSLLRVCALPARRADRWLPKSWRSARNIEV